MMSSNIDVIKSLCKLVSNTFDLATLFIEPNGNVAFECINNQVLNPLYKNEKQNLFNTMQFNPNEQSSFPVIRKTLLSENYILISIFLNDDFNGTVLIGPSKPHEFSKIELNGLINDVQGFFPANKSLIIIKLSQLLHMRN